MKGQSEIVVFILLFFVGIILFSLAFFFSSGIFNQNLDMGKVAFAENIMKSLNSKIQSTIGYGGSQTFDYALNENIRILDSQTLEIYFPVSIEVSDYWINVTSEERSYVREVKEQGVFRIQLIYPEADDLRIEFFSDIQVAKPTLITMEKNSTSVVNGKPVIRIRLIFK